MKTLTKKRGSLSIQIEGQNELNSYAKKVLTEVLPELKKLIGQKILLADGNKSKKFIIPSHGSEDTKGENKHIGRQYWFDFGNPSTWIKVKICINGGSYGDNTAYCVYFEKSIYIGETKLQAITKLEEYENIVKSYELDKVFYEDNMMALIAAYKETKEQANKLLRQIPEQIQGSEYLRNI